MSVSPDGSRSVEASARLSGPAGGLTVAVVAALMLAAAGQAGAAASGGVSAGGVPDASPWQSAGNMSTGRASGMIAFLQNGHALVAGGLHNTTVIKSAELYTPSSSGTGTWTTTGSLNAPRQSAGAVTMFDGRVLVAGGKTTSNTIVATAEVYDPTTGTWATSGSMSKARNGMTVTLLYGGKVLVAGGTDIGSPVDPLKTAELYDPSTGTFSATGSMATGRAFATATLLPTGKVLVAGGVISSNGTLGKSAELYDPTTGTWSSGGSMAAARDHQMSALLFDGRDLVIGGQGSLGKPLATAELYTPGSNSWSSGGTFSGGRTAAATEVLYSGKVLLGGGFGGNGNTVLSSANVYTPNGGAGTWAAITAMPAPRGHPMDVRLNTGKALVAGGWADNGSSISLQSALLYAPSPNPTLTLPQSGMAGATVKATGGGFTPGEQVKLSFDGAALATVTTNTNGGFTVNVTIPAGASVGGHLTEAAGQTSGRVAQRWFAVIA
jgi:Kelch motif/Galactose oxidase, central domain